MTFASHGENGDERYVFGLPGNPVSAQVTFNLVVLPALRNQCGYSKDKLLSPIIPVEASFYLYSSCADNEKRMKIEGWKGESLNTKSVLFLKLCKQFI